MKKVVTIILVVILLALCYTGGYYLGRKAGEAAEAEKIEAEEKVVAEEVKEIDEVEDAANEVTKEEVAESKKYSEMTDTEKLAVVEELFKAKMEENNKTQGDDAFTEIRIDKSVLEVDQERIEQFFGPDEKAPDEYILAWVEYSLKVPNKNTPYLAGNGEYKDGWVVEKENYVFIEDGEVKDFGTGF